MKKILKIICWIKGHKFKHPEKGKAYVYCQRCGSDVFKQALRYLENKETKREIKEKLKTN